jgi:hypothetical protein
MKKRFFLLTLAACSFALAAGDLAGIVSTRPIRARSGNSHLLIPSPPRHQGTGRFSVPGSWFLVPETKNQEPRTDFELPVLAPMDPPEETLHYDGANDDALGLTHGGTFYCAARFTPTLACTLKAILFYHADPSHDAAVYVYGPGNDSVPGAILDSAAYSGASTGWLRVNLTTPVALAPDLDFWTSVRCVHDSDFYPMGIDAGPLQHKRGGFFSANGTSWIELTRLGLDVNANIRAIIALASCQLDVGVTRIVAPRGFAPGGPMTPSATVKNFGLGTANNVGVRMYVTPGGYASYREIPSINSADTARVAFDDWTPSGGGFYSVRCTTELSGDMFPQNDRLTVAALVPNFTETFEAGNGGYTADGSPPPCWTRGAPGSPRPAAHSGAKVWGAPLTGDYADGADWKLYSCVYAAQVDSPAIAFYHWYDIEQGPDGGNLCCSPDTGRTWNYIRPWTEYSAPYDEYVYSLNSDGYTGQSGTGWKVAVFRIPVVAGTPVQLRWRFASDGSDTRPGWILDDVSGIGIQIPTGIADRRTGSLQPRLAVSPNPATGDARVAYWLPFPGRVTLKLFDATGRLMSTLARGYHPAGEYSEPVGGLESPASGAYFLKLDTETGSTTTGFIMRIGRNRR